MFMGGGYCYNVELIRLIGIILIMGHHLYHIGFEGTYIFKNCWVWVDLFFILTGSFTYKHFVNKKDTSEKRYGTMALRYTINKFRRFFLLTAISVVVMCVISYGELLLQYQWKQFARAVVYAPFEMFYLTSSGITKALNAPIWFLSAMFIVLPIISYLIQAYPEMWKVISFTLPILYFGYKGVNTDRAWPNDLVRAFVCIALGTIAVLLAGKIKDFIGTSKKKMVIATIIEITCLVIAIYISSFNKSYINLMEPLFVIIVSLMLSQSTATALIDNSVVLFVGKLSMPMFIFHWCVGSICVLITNNIYYRTLIYYVGTIVVAVIVVLIMDYLSQRRMIQNKRFGNV